MSVATELRAFLLTQTTITDLVGARIHQDVIPQVESGDDDSAPPTRPPTIWFSKSSTEREECLEDGQGTLPEKVFFDLEVFASSKPDADDLSEAVEGVNDYAGVMGSMTVQGIFVDSASDDYLPKGILSDDGTFQTAFSVEVIPRY